MTASKIIIVLLSQQGYWFGGQAGTVSIQLAARVPVSDTVLAWDLVLDDLRLAHDELALTDANRANAASVRLTVPEVRVRTEMRWEYRLVDRKNGKELSRGQELISVYPTDLLASVARRLGGRNVLLLDGAMELSSVLADVGIKHERVPDASKLSFSRDDIVLVASNQLGSQSFAQTPLVNLASSGASVMFLEQTSSRVLAGYPVGTRLAADTLEWRIDHPLFRSFSPTDLQSLLKGRLSGLVYPILLPADEPVWEIGYWPSESDSRDPRPIDALVAAKAVGNGRLVLCQLPLGNWKTDPRSQVFLANAFDYLATRPEPTPSFSQRVVVQVAATQPVPTIAIPSGDQP